MKRLWFIPILFIAAGAYAATYSGTATGPELDYVHGVTSGIQAQLNAKAPSSTTATQAGVQAESYTAADDTGTANAYAISITPTPTLAAYSWFSFKALNANTGASTLAVNGGAAKNIYKYGGTIALSGGEIQAGQVVRVIYDGTNYQMQSQTARPNVYMQAEYDNGTCTTAKTISPINGARQKVTLTNAQSCALTLTQPTSGTAVVGLKIIQSASSTYNGTISGCKWAGGTVMVPTATTGAIDFISIYLDGTNAYCAVSGQAFQ